MNEWEWKTAIIGERGLKNKFVIVIPCYNAEETIENTVLSVLNQDFNDLGIIIRNDQSKDKTDEIVKNIFDIKNPEGDFYVKNNRRDVIYIENKKKLYGPGATYESVISYIHEPFSIVGVVDGDDSLYVQDAVSTIYQAYRNNSEKWLIWSQHISRVQSSRNVAGYSLPLPPDDIIYTTRRYWGVSHFRTSLAGLFYLVDPEDLHDPHTPGQYAKVCGDAAFLYPMIEMCGNRHSMFINKALYYYNDGIVSNDAEVYKSELAFYKRYFESKQQYAPLPNGFRFE